MPKSCPNIRFPHQQDFFPIRSVTKFSTARFSHENLVEKFKIFVQDFVPIRTALIYELPITAKNTTFFYRGNFTEKSPGKNSPVAAVLWKLMAQIKLAGRFLVVRAEIVLITEIPPLYAQYAAASSVIS